jgi:hypothetical protein
MEIKPMKVGAERIRETGRPETMKMCLCAMSKAHFVTGLHCQIRRRVSGRRTVVSETSIEKVEVKELTHMIPNLVNRRGFDICLDALPSFLCENLTQLENESVTEPAPSFLTIDVTRRMKVSRVRISSALISVRESMRQK